LMKNFEGYGLGELKVISLLQEDTSIAGTPTEEKLKAQAQLKGSVGGVQALLELQKSVASKTTDYSAAVAIIKEIFGIDEETAKQMLGTPTTPITPQGQ